MDTGSVEIPTSPAGALSPLKGAGEAGRTSPRSDALPEFHTYLDVGCQVHPRCLQCTLPSCIYDSPGGFQAYRSRFRQCLVHYALTVGVPYRVIARYLHVSHRQLFRIAQQARHVAHRPQQARLGSLVPLPSTTRRNMIPTA